MGIKGFSILLNHLGCKWETTSLATFAGKIMAVDGIMFLYQTKLSPRQPARVLVDFLNRLRTVNIQPIFVMDGKYVYEKGQEQASRAQKRRTLQDVISRLYSQLEMYKLSREIGNDLEKLVNSNTPLFTNKLSNTLNVAAITAHIAKLVREASPIPRHMKDLFINICDAFGVPVLWAKNDGEMLCAELNRTGKADVVFSHDSDVFAAEAVTVIKQIDGMTAKTLGLSRILDAANLSFPAFRDMCILCGTDFNKRIPGLSPVTAYNLIKTYNSLENVMANTDHDISSLNFTRVREIYSSETFNNTITFRKPSKDKIHTILTAHNLQNLIPVVNKIWTFGESNDLT